MKGMAKGDVSAHRWWTLVLWRCALDPSSGSGSRSRLGSAEAEPEGNHTHVNPTAAWTPTTNGSTDLSTI